MSRILLSATATMATATFVAGALVTPALAEGETCRGQAATIVGAPGETVTGTDGDDVIVTNGEHDVYAGDGDDVICVTEVPEYGYVHVRAGAGADVVDTRAVTADRAAVGADLGPGRDRYVGGPRDDGVHGDSELAYDREYDRISTGGGDDSVTTGWAGGVDTDDVDLGTGDNYLTLASERSTGSLRAAPGSDSKVTLTVSSSGAWVIDDRADRATFKGRTMSSWANLSVAELHGPRGARMRYVGTDRADRPDIFGHVTGVDLGGGNDDVALYQFPRLRGSYLGGPGEDRVRFESGDELLVDLGRGRLGTEIGRPTAQIHGFENLDALFFAKVWLVGSRADNRIRFSTCDGSVNGGPGDDRIAMHGTGPSCGTHPPGILVHAGRGDDTIRGTPFWDSLYGGPGHDVAVGGDGTDICRAEVETTCEE